MSKQERRTLRNQTETPKIELTAASMITGIGRKATNEELIAYLSKNLDQEPINLDIAFAKFNRK